MENQPKNFQQNKNQFSTSNYQQLADPTFIKLKLDTSGLLQRIESFLSAKKIVIRKLDSGELEEQIVQVGKPYANEEGIAAILNIVDMVANNHTVQGNMDRIEFYDYLADVLLSISRTIISNQYEWKITDESLEMLIDNIFFYLRAFLSRTIDNKERESLTPSFSSSEVSSLNGQQKQGILQRFTGGNK